MLYTFYVVDRNEEGELRVYSAASFTHKYLAEEAAKQVSMLMGGVKYVVEELK
jgi:hypothetical protein